jgi:hypothetical protein
VRLYKVGMVTAVLLASTAMAAAQNSTGHRYRRHHTVRHAVSVPSEYQARPAEYQGNAMGTEPIVGPHYGRAAGGPEYANGNKLLPSGSDEMNKMYEWRTSR